MTSTPTRCIHFLIWSALTAFVGLDGPAAGADQSTWRPLSDQPSVRTRQVEPLSPAARQFLQERDGATVRVWVYFTDKGVRDRTGYEAAAARVALTERALKRRAKVDQDRVLFVDLPVSRQYTESIEALGAELRRTSRWLNAASFDIPASRLDSIAGLPFVSAVRPVARFESPHLEYDSARPAPPDEALSPQALDYGPALGQMTQINVAAAHQKGYSGAGVTLAIMDTGFRKTHEAFSAHYQNSRVLAEYDFVQDDPETANQPGDASDQWSHGTAIWSISGGWAPGQIVGPAFGANFILCKTENVSSETPVEEDNWVAALEFADSIGADVITTSLGYSDWYAYSDFDGQTATITLAANTCDSLGIVTCIAMGNDGPSPGTLSAPADAFNILAVGAVDAGGYIASFSSRGPTYDGRIKPEVCAQGVSTYAASSAANNRYMYANGTSASTPLVGGAVCLVIEAHPDFSPFLIREALKVTADRAASPGNTYGWGILNVDAAVEWPVGLGATSAIGGAPLTVSFTNESQLRATSALWEFGDGGSATVENPVHQYNAPGSYDVTLAIETDLGSFTKTVPRMVLVHADSLRADSVWAEPGTSVRCDVYARNFIPLDRIELPFIWQGTLDVEFDSFSTAGLRTEYFAMQMTESYDPGNKRAAVSLSIGGGQPRLDPGSGAIVSLHFTVSPGATTGLTPVAIAPYSRYSPIFVSADTEYPPTVQSGYLSYLCCVGTVGDVDGRGGDVPTIGDISLLIDHLFINLPALECYPEADADQSGGAQPIPDDITIGDITRLIDFLYLTGTPLPGCL